MVSVPRRSHLLQAHCLLVITLCKHGKGAEALEVKGVSGQRKLWCLVRCTRKVP